MLYTLTVLNEPVIFVLLSTSMNDSTGFNPPGAEISLFDGVNAKVITNISKITKAKIKKNLTRFFLIKEIT